MAVKCLGSEAKISSVEEVFNELDHLRYVIKSIMETLTDEPHWHEYGIGKVAGAIVDQGMVLALATERLERLIEVGRSLRHNGRVSKRLHAMAASQEG